MRFVSLFTGIGGMDLGLERAGHECVAQIENDPWCTKLLTERWPNVPKWSDVHDVSGSALPATDCLVGGFPCQPFSVAGKREGISDPRWLWPQFARLVDEIRPRYVVVENVPGVRRAGGPHVVADLTEMGYDTQWGELSAAAFGAPHLRRRFFLVAYPSSDELRDEPGGRSRESREGTPVPGDDGEEGTVADTDSPGLVWVPTRHGTQGSLDLEPWDDPHRRHTGPRPVADPQVFTVGTGLRQDEPTRIWGRRFSDSYSPSHTWTVEPDVGRVADGVPSRVDRLRGLGNAVVPQIAQWVGYQLTDLDTT
jgi:DNA (cytosine-5)-methyltransferase 1